MKFLATVIGMIFVSFSGVSCFAQSSFEEQKKNLFDDINSNSNLLPLRDTVHSSVSLETLLQGFVDIEKKLQSVGSATSLEASKARQAAEEVLQQSKESLQQLNQTIEHIISLQKTITLLKKQRISLESDMKDIQEKIAIYTRVLYQLHNRYYSDASLSELKLFSYSDDISQSLSKNEFIHIIHEKLGNGLEQASQQHTASIQTLSEYNQQKIQAGEEQKVLEQTITQLQQQEQQIRSLYSIFVGDYGEDANILDYLRDSAEGTALPVGLGKQKSYFQNAIAGVVSVPDKAVEGNYFTRPVLPVKKILAYPGEFGSGIYLSLAGGSVIHSPAPGIVYKISKNLGGLNTQSMVIVHKDGLVSILLPFSKVLVSEGQFVERGQILGIQGGKKPTDENFLATKDSYLYRELQHNDINEDPLQRLDLSIFPNQDILQESYHLKYIHDMTLRTVDLSGKPSLAGKTVEQRVASFLERFAPAPYNDIGVWLAGNKGTGVDPYFGLCIGRAETSYRNFKSSNNIGNVGNDDSGNTREFESVESGISALYNVLNNRYLEHYNTIDQLSRFGNKDDYIYASSPINWQANNMKCLSAIYGYNLPEDYPFRVQK